MKKQFKSYIDSFEYYNNSIEKCVLLSGWCFFGNGEEVSYTVKCNGKDYNFNIEKIDRPDVEVQYQLNSKKNLYGFYIKVEFNGNNDLNDFILEAHHQNEQQTILRLNKNQIRKKENNSVFHYALDQFETKNDICALTGYAFTPGAKEEINISILNCGKKTVESKLSRITRKDVLKMYHINDMSDRIGFRIEFPSSELNPYYVKFDLEGCELTVPAEPTLSIAQLTKAYIKTANPERIKNAVRYLKENGVKRFIHRVRLGPLSMPELSYPEWFEKMNPDEKELEQQKTHTFSYTPKISLIVAAYNTPKKYLQEMIDSIVSQTYKNWELCIADGSSTNEVNEYIEKRVRNEKIKYIRLKENYGISENMNAALKLVTGDFIGFFDHDDLLTPNALYEVVNCLQDKNIEMVYSDEDKYDTSTRKLTEPHFKPDFSIDLLRSVNYICHLLVVKKSLIDKIGAFDKTFDGAQDYDFTLRAVEVLKPNQIAHIPKILYHWRMHSASTAANPESKLYAFEAGKRAIEAHLTRLNIHAEVRMSENLGMYDVYYKVKNDPLVSIIIPNKDHSDDLSRAIESIQEKSTYRNFEFIVVENNSTDEKTFVYYKEIQNKYKNVKVVFWKDEFNYSAINNYGASFAKGEYILLLNNDTEMIEPDSIKDMVGICQRKEVGAVGARLYYEDDTIQHAGVIIGLGKSAGHAFLNTPRNQGGYFNRVFAMQDVSAVTAACMLIRKDVFDEVHGLYEGLKVAFNDVDLCLKIRDRGYLIVYDPHAVFYHYESKSRGMEDTPEKIARFNREILTLSNRWEQIYELGDPYYNVNLSLLVKDYSLKMPDEIQMEKQNRLAKAKSKKQSK
ncbi:glycosyltransferase family 2 protein [Erysipelotrichaceae bacterium 66-17]